MKKTIHRKIRKAGEFVSMDKGFLNDKELSWKAKGLMSYLLSKPDDWKIIHQDLQNMSEDGRTAVSTGLRELIEHGYVKREEIRDKGKFLEYKYSVFEEPQTD